MQPLGTTIHSVSPLDNDFITIDDACREIGGTRPISRATYYRGAKAKLYPAPVHPSPGISRVRHSELLAAIAARIARNDEAA